MRLLYFILGALVGGLVAISAATGTVINLNRAAYELAQEAFRLGCISEKGSYCLDKSLIYRDFIENN